MRLQKHNSAVLHCFSKEYIFISLQSQPTRMKKVSLILDLLTRRGKKAYGELLRALDYTHQDELAQGLRDIYDGGTRPPPTGSPNGPVDLRRGHSNMSQLPMDDVDALSNQNIINFGFTH